MGPEFERSRYTCIFSVNTTWILINSFSFCSRHSIPGDPPRSLQLLSSGGEILRRLEEAEVGPAEEGQQTSRGCLIVQTNMFIGYDGETSGGNDPTKTTRSHGPRESPKQQQPTILVLKKWFRSQLAVTDFDCLASFVGHDFGRICSVGIKVGTFLIVSCTLHLYDFAN